MSRKIKGRQRNHGLRFRLVSFDEISSMNTEEWESICRECGADFGETPEEEPVRETVEASRVLNAK